MEVHLAKSQAFDQEKKCAEGLSVQLAACGPVRLLPCSQRTRVRVSPAGVSSLVL